MSLLERFVNQYGRLPTEVDPDYLEMLRMTKYIIKDYPEVNPAKCANCGSSKKDGRMYIDFGLTVDWFGVVYLCGFCLKDIATAMGLFDELEEKLKTLAALRFEDEDTKLRGEELYQKVVKTFEEFREFYGNLSSDRQFNHESTSGANPNVGSDQTAKTTISETHSGSKQRTTKSTPVSGSKNLLSLTEFLDSPGSQ